MSDARGDEPVHFIGIFHENCNLEYIWGQLKNRTPISEIEGNSKKENEVYCDLIDTISLVHKLGGITTIHSGEKHGSLETITNSLKHAMAQKEDIAKNVDVYELGKASDQNGYREVVFPCIKKVLPMIICSDNHDIKNYEFKEMCWIKADPTFEGFLQVINEPEERVYIGDVPPIITKVGTHKTKYIKELSISQVDGYEGTQGTWFKDIRIPLNSELVAIIGNKGSGKSAIADIISLCSNYYDDKDFSFLTSKKFRIKSGKIAQNFTAQLTWESGVSKNRNLNETPNPTEVLDVKYLPQGQFERLTNEISTAKEFQEEIESVVFSHIPETERLGTTSFSELIDKKSLAVEKELSLFKFEIYSINKTIIDLEKKATDYYCSEIKYKRDKKEEELKALTEPVKVSDPNEDPEKKRQSEEINKKISYLKNEIKAIEESIDKTEKNKKNAFETIQLLSKIIKEVGQKKIEIERFVLEKTNELSGFEIDIEKLISVSIDDTEIETLLKTKEEELSLEKLKLGEAESTEKSFKSLREQLSEKQQELKTETDKLDSEQKAYQEYLFAQANWEKERERIIGNSETIDSLEYYNNILFYIEHKLCDDLKAKYEERRKIICNIFAKKQEVVSIYKEVRKKLNHIIAGHSDTLKDYSVSVEAALAINPEFKINFLNHILLNKAGSFYSSAGGESKLAQFISDIDFDNFESVVFFLDNITHALHYDERNGQKKAKRNVTDQVKNVEDLYNYLFTLTFLENNYQLKQGDKDIEQLSPGERGALLLVFYLLLDKNDIPLIIDQPEDNLDNNSVAMVLVPFIRAAKKNRQIIMITHNPNLAVVSDAEQVIYVDLDKKDDYKFSIISGSIEDKTVNAKIVDVLEGAMPAFNTRKRKYYES